MTKLFMMKDDLNAIHTERYKRFIVAFIKLKIVKGEYLHAISCILCFKRK